jgi:hypothetical protein
MHSIGTHTSSDYVKYFMSKAKKIKLQSVLNYIVRVFHLLTFEALLARIQQSVLPLIIEELTPSRLNIPLRPSR